ncbi:hypothetical protein FRC08_003633 [Ceratobasidium sp. 394]|nr:hypothetical protein FRC08_003633 [Ceratobasidium sp. 394]
MSSKSKRTIRPLPETANRPGAKRVKFSSLAFSGSRSQFTSRDATTSSRDSNATSSQHTLHFADVPSTQASTQTWHAPETNVDDPWPEDGLDSVHMTLDGEEDLEYLVGARTGHSGKVIDIHWLPQIRAHLFKGPK